MSRLLLGHARPQTQCLVFAAQGDKADREKMRAMDAEKVRQEKAQRKKDDALMEPARLAARGLSLEEIEREMQRQGLPVERQFLQRQIEKASRNRVKEEEEPFYAVNKDVSDLIAPLLLFSPLSVLLYIPRLCSPAWILLQSLCANLFRCPKAEQQYLDHS